MRDVAILEHILLDWRIWDKAVEKDWQYLLWQLEQLLKPPDAASKNCPSRASFNINCFIKANAVVRILLTSKVGYPVPLCLLARISQYRITRKFDKELNLAVWQLRRPPNENLPILFSPAMCNDVMHTVVLLAPPGTTLRELYI